MWFQGLFSKVLKSELLKTLNRIKYKSLSVSNLFLLYCSNKWLINENHDKVFFIKEIEIILILIFWLINRGQSTTTLLYPMYISNKICAKSKVNLTVKCPCLFLQNNFIPFKVTANFFPILETCQTVSFRYSY